MKFLIFFSCWTEQASQSRQILPFLVPTLDPFSYLSGLSDSTTAQRNAVRHSTIAQEARRGLPAAPREPTHAADASCFSAGSLPYLWLAGWLTLNQEHDPRLTDRLSLHSKKNTRDTSRATVQNNNSFTLHTQSSVAAKVLD